MAFKRIVSNEGSFFIKYDEENKVFVFIRPDVSKITITKENFIDVLNYMNSADSYMLQNRLFKDKRTVVERFTENTNDIVIEQLKYTSQLYPEFVLKTISIATGLTTASITVPASVIPYFVQLAEENNITATEPKINGVEYVDELPAETRVQKDVVYMVGNTLYKLNEAEDALVTVTTTPNVKVLPSYPEVTPIGKEGVYYNLTKAMDKPKYAAGIYTFSASNNKYTAANFTLVKVAALPAVDVADAKKVYILTKNVTEDGEVVKAKGTAWKLVPATTVEPITPASYAEFDMSKVQTVNELPFREVGENGAYYNVNGVISKYSASTKTYEKLGNLMVVDALPDVSQTVVPTDVVYILQKAQGNKAAGSMWIFTEDKEFVAYPIVPEEDDDEEEDKEPEGGPED